MFDVGLPEFFVLGLVALLVFGPERLPEVALQAARLIRRLRTMAESAKSELSDNLEPHMRELSELRELDPRKMAKRYIMDPVDKDGTLADLKSLDPRKAAGAKTKRSVPAKAAAVDASVSNGASGAAAAALAAGEVAPTGAGSNGAPTLPTPEFGDGPAVPPAMAPAVTPVGERPPYDLDAT